MTHEPTLVIMAAGMGSRFGGLKQMTPVDGEGHFIIDFSLYDAYQAGFRRVAFIIKHEIEKTFRETIGARMEKLSIRSWTACRRAFPFPLDAKSPGARRMRSPAAAAWSTGILP